MLQLVVRSKFREDDGGQVKGAFTPTILQQYLPRSVRHQRNLFVQASDRWSPFQGCCLVNTHGNCFNLAEHHFIDFHNGNWDLFFDHEFNVNECYRFILVPHRKLCVILDCRNWHNWTLLGTCQASTLRLDIEKMIQTSCNVSSGLDHRGTFIGSQIIIPQQQQPLDKPKHWHITVFMDSFKVHRNFTATCGDIKLPEKQQERSVFKTDPQRPLVNFSHASSYCRHPFGNRFHTSRGQDVHQTGSHDDKENSSRDNCG